MLDYKFLETWNKLMEANLGDTVGAVPYTKFTEDRGDGITEEQWTVLKAKYSSAGAKKSIYIDQDGNLTTDLAAKEGSQWLYNLQLMINAFAIENDVLTFINQNKTELEAEINKNLNINRQRVLARKKIDTAQPELSEIKLNDEYQLAGTPEQHTDLLSQIPLEGGKGAVDIRAVAPKQDRINKIEVKATFKYFSGLPKNTRFHGTELVALYSLSLKKLYFYYYDDTADIFVKVAKFDYPIKCIKLLPESIKVIDY